MKARFYHWWVYWLFCTVWNPIFKSNVPLAKEFIRLFTQWLEEHEAELKEEA
jgi:hypothetical protein